MTLSETHWLPSVARHAKKKPRPDKIMWSWLYLYFVDLSQRKKKNTKKYPACKHKLRDMSWKSPRRVGKSNGAGCRRRPSSIFKRVLLANVLIDHFLLVWVVNSINEYDVNFFFWMSSFSNWDRCKNYCVNVRVIWSDDGKNRKRLRSNGSERYTCPYVSIFTERADLRRPLINWQT